MIGVAALTLLLVNVPFSHSCDEVEQVLICPNLPPYFSPGYLTLVMYLNGVGEINSTVFHSSNLTSVTTLRIDNAGVTGIAEGAFGSFQNLRGISLRRNALTQMNPKWFGRPAVLSELSLAENQIEAVNESMLTGLINLTKLSLNKNRIRTIETNSFQSQTDLAELDLSENRMTRVSPQVFRSLRSTRIRLDGNPWDCSCGAEDFVVFLKDLQSRSLLDRQTAVTCESPPSLRGRPVWDVSVCVTSPTPGPPSASPTVQLRPTDALTTVPASSGTSGSSFISQVPDSPANLM
ncbi:phospholipase A2 inhibitor beta-like [Seriola aureovittata]|uniref:phospholipase A2 inhibitor beta-like n=1 Tax=Seriola aureovittata TaxID=2871759 RepID=UPI0024BDAE42|nr:phospholipase A2 inhibitor beta-like [Seriola aureovittata]